MIKNELKNGIWHPTESDYNMSKDEEEFIQQLTYCVRLLNLILDSGDDASYKAKVNVKNGRVIINELNSPGE